MRECGCVPPTGSGGWKLCPEGYCLLVAYYQAIDGQPGERAAWWGKWRAFSRHIGQPAEVTA